MTACTLSNNTRFHSHTLTMNGVANRNEKCLYFPFLGSSDPCDFDYCYALKGAISGVMYITINNEIVTQIT